MAIQMSIKSTLAPHKFENLDTIYLLHLTKLDAKVYHFISYLEIASFILWRFEGNRPKYFNYKYNRNQKLEI